MPLSDHVQVTIQINSIGIARLGYGVPMILSQTGTAGWSEHIRFYTGTAGVAGDFAVTSPEYLAAQAMFGQANQPQQIAIGRATHLPTQQYTLGAQQAVNSTAYNLVVLGGTAALQTVTITSAASASIAEIHTDMVTALNAVSGKNWSAAQAALPSLTPQTFTADHTVPAFTTTGHGYQTGDGPTYLSEVGGGLPTGITASTNYWIIRLGANTWNVASTQENALNGTAVVWTSNGSGTLTSTPQAGATSPILPFTVTGAAPGDWFSIEARDSAGLASQTMPTWWSNAQTHSDPSITTDLNTIAAENGAWYALDTQFNSAAVVEAAAAWVESNTRLYCALTCDTQSITGVVTAGGMADSLKSSEYTRTSAWYHPSVAQMLVSALYGLVLPLTPGSETWKYKQPVGPAPVQLSGTHRVNLVAKNANTYQGETSTTAFTWEGTSASGEFIDTVRGIDAFVNDLQDSILEALLASPKIPYTDQGVTILANEASGAMARAVVSGTFAEGTTTVTVPKVATVSTANKKARIFPGMQCSAELAGAVHFADITVTVTQ